MQKYFSGSFTSHTFRATHTVSDREIVSPRRYFEGSAELLTMILLLARVLATAASRSVIACEKGAKNKTRRKIFFIEKYLLESKISSNANRDIVSVAAIFVTMGETEKYFNNSPSEEKTNHDISGIVNASDDPRETSDKPKYKKYHRSSWTVEKCMKRPPGCSPEHRMSRRERIIREVIDERRDTAHSLWARPYREHLVDDPVQSKCSQNMPEEIERYMFWSVIFQRYSIEP